MRSLLLMAALVVALMVVSAPALAEIAPTAPAALAAPVWTVMAFSARVAGSAAPTLEPRGLNQRLWPTFTLTINAQ